MNRLLTRFTIIAGLAGALAFSTSATAAITGSEHDLTPTGNSQVSNPTATNEICVYCHTPHAASTAAAAPLWNKTLADPAGFDTYDNGNSSTIDGEVLAVGSVSLACLSCHDGSQAMDVVINAPGSGLAGVGGTDLNTGSTGLMGGIAAIGGGTGDLTNDHPIGIEYAAGACNTATAPTGAGTCAATAVDPDFATANFDVINGAAAYWVNSTAGAGTSREKVDMILYTRSFSGGALTGPSVECGSCHDPHEGGGTVSFMRISNEQSNVCLTCHTK